MKRIWDILKDTFAPRVVWSIFNNDAHNIVSKRGWQRLKQKRNEKE